MRPHRLAGDRGRLLHRNLQPGARHMALAGFHLQQLHIGAVVGILDAGTVHGDALHQTLFMGVEGIQPVNLVELAHVRRGIA